MVLHSHSLVYGGRIKGQRPFRKYIEIYKDYSTTEWMNYFNVFDNIGFFSLQHYEKVHLNQHMESSILDIGYSGYRDWLERVEYISLVEKSFLGVLDLKIKPIPKKIQY